MKQDPQELTLNQNTQESFLNSLKIDLEQLSKEAPPKSALEEQIALLNQHQQFLWNQLAVFPLSSYNFLSPNYFSFQNDISFEKLIANEAFIINASANEPLEKLQNQKYFKETTYLQPEPISNEVFMKEEQQYPLPPELYLPLSNSPLSLSEQSQISGNSTINGGSTVNKLSNLSSSPQSFPNPSTLDTKIDLYPENVDTHSVGISSNNEKDIKQENGWCTMQAESKSSGTPLKKRKEIGEALTRKRQRVCTYSIRCLFLLAK
jgi:hypothetical protein